MTQSQPVVFTSLVIGQRAKSKQSLSLRKGVGSLPIIIIGLAYNHVPYGRVTATCKNRAAPGAAMTGNGYNGTPVQP